MLQNYIDGTWVASSAKSSVPVINPATEEVIGHTPLGTEGDLQAAVDAAKRAFGPWRKTPAADRVQYLFKLKTLLEANVDEIAGIITRENGKTLVEARGSARRAIQMVETACGIPSLLMGEHFEDIAQGIDCSAVRRPMGVFACIGPFNFPAMIPFWFWPFAVACGNTYIIKPSERVPLSMQKIFELLHQVGFPPGVINMVHGGKDIAEAICEHPGIKGVSFVGSTPVAKHVYTLGCQTGKRVQALGGSKNVMVVLDDALQGAWCDRTVHTAVESVTGCAGERCLAGSLVLAVGDAAYRTLATETVKVAKTITVGPGNVPGVTMGPLISADAKKRVEGLIARAIEEGAQVLLDGRVGQNKTGYFLAPTVLGGITENMEIAHVEIFGPVILLGKVADFDASIAWINRLSFANTATLFTSSGAHARKFAYEIDPSMIGINIGVPAPMSFFSFGGSKDSFFGDTKAHGKGCINFFTDTYTTIYRWYSQGSIW